MDPPVAAREHRRDRPLPALCVLGPIVTVVGAPARREQPDVRPAAAVRVRSKVLDRRLGRHGEVDPLGQMLGLSGDRIDDRGAVGARRADRVPVGTGDEHEAVEEQRVLPVLEQLRQRDRARTPRDDVPLPKLVVGGYRTAERQLAALRGHFLGPPAQLCLGTQQFVARSAVLLGLAGEPHLVKRRRPHAHHLSGLEGLGSVASSDRGLGCTPASSLRRRGG